MSLMDKTLTCRDCGADFLFTAGEQEFFQSKGLLHEP
ncbi:MAG TPA: zinc-ribbon domain-containing protein, partial [Chloroflexota bacterium]